MAERKNDLTICESELYWLRRSPTFEAFLEREKLIREKDAYQRLTRVNRAVLEHRMKQCSPALAIDESTGLRGWQRGIVSGYFVDGVFHKCRSESIKEHYQRINEDNIPCVTVWEDCPFNPDLNGKIY